MNSYGERPHRGYTLVKTEIRKQKSTENYRFWYGLLSKWLEYQQLFCCCLVIYNLSSVPLSAWEATLIDTLNILVNYLIVKSYRIFIIQSCIVLNIMITWYKFIIFIVWGKLFKKSKYDS